MKRHLRIAALLISVSMPAFAVAQTTAPDVAAPPPANANPAVDPGQAWPNGSGLNDIVVTAQKRSESVQNIPIAIMAVSGKSLAERQVTGIDQLGSVAPSVNFGTYGAAARIAVRGVGFDAVSPGSEGRVAYHVDGTYISRPSAQLFRVEADQTTGPALAKPSISNETTKTSLSKNNENGFGRSLADRGLYLHGLLHQATTSVIHGGAKRGTEYVGLGFWGFDIDTARAFGIPGGLLNVTIATQFGSATLAEHNIGSNAFNNWAFGPGLGLVNFYYDQRLLHGALHLTIGRTTQLQGLPYSASGSLSPSFHNLPWACSFFTLSCGGTHAFNVNANKPGYKAGSWAGLVTLHPARNWYVKGGVIANDQLQTLSRRNIGWPGSDWNAKINGAYFPLQIGYVTSPASSLYPTNVHLGGFVDTARYADKYLNSTGQPIAVAGGTPLYHDRAAGIFAGLQQTVIRLGDDNGSRRSIAVIASFDWDLVGRQVVKHQLMAGLITTGPFRNRPADTLNLVVSTERFNARQREGREAIAAVHGVRYDMQDETGFELNYAFALAPGATFSPYVQYLVHPDQLSVNVPDPANRNAVAAGIRLIMRFDTIFGFPQPSG